MITKVSHPDVFNPSSPFDHVFAELVSVFDKISLRSLDLILRILPVFDLSDLYLSDHDWRSALTHKA